MTVAAHLSRIIGVLGLVMLALLLASVPRAETITIVDDVGREVSLSVPVRRTVIFNRYTTEFVRAIAGTDVIVGVDQGHLKDPVYWPSFTHDMVVGQGQGEPNYEAIVALKPDVVFMPRNSVYPEAIETLKPFGIPVVVITSWDVMKHRENVDLLGHLYAQPERAASLNAFYQTGRDLLAERLKGVRRKRVYMEEVGDYKTLLNGSGWHDMIEIGGGLNVFGDIDLLGQSSTRGNVQGFTVDPEEVLARQPEVMLKLQPGQYAPHDAVFSRTVLDAIAARPSFADLPAVRNGEVYHMSYYLAGGCSKIVGALQIAKWLYPDQFADIDPGAVMKVWLEEFQGVPYPGGYWTSLRQTRP